MARLGRAGKGLVRAGLAPAWGWGDRVSEDAGRRRVWGHAETCPRRGRCCVGGGGPLPHGRGSVAGGSGCGLGGRVLEGAGYRRVWGHAEACPRRGAVLRGGFGGRLSSRLGDTLKHVPGGGRCCMGDGGLRGGRASGLELAGGDAAVDSVQHRVRCYDCTL